MIDSYSITALLFFLLSNWIARFQKCLKVYPGQVGGRKGSRKPESSEKDRKGIKNQPWLTITSHHMSLLTTIINHKSSFDDAWLDVPWALAPDANSNAADVSWSWNPVAGGALIQHVSTRGSLMIICKILFACIRPWSPQFLSSHHVPLADSFVAHMSKYYKLYHVLFAYRESSCIREDPWSTNAMCVMPVMYGSNVLYGIV